ncbi:CRPV-132 [Crowpox virus]|nr:CRPV-132 [Crowpox virus]
MYQKTEKDMINNKLLDDVSRVRLKNPDVINETDVIVELLKLYRENNNLELRISNLKKRNRILENKINKLKLELDTYSR